MFDPCQELGRSNPKFHKPNFSNVQETPNKTSSYVWSLPGGNSLRGEHLASNPTDLAALSGLVKPPRLARSNFTADQSPCFGCLLLLPCEKGKRFPWISLNGTMKPPRNQIQSVDLDFWPVLKWHQTSWDATPERRRLPSLLKCKPEWPPPSPLSSPDPKLQVFFFVPVLSLLSLPLVTLVHSFKSFNPHTRPECGGLIKPLLASRFTCHDIFIPL